MQDPLVLRGVDLGDPLVQLGERGDVGNGDQVGAAEPAALLFHPALLVGAFLTGDAVERVEAVADLV
ncbi:hypothetical protein [Streptomyces sp. NPDC088910]|uniref:hypothetical protein n=1 Tax=Streptomyces sp. NPDC088910 TaxID=3365911 RepID=UPI0037F52C7B